MFEKYRLTGAAIISFAYVIFGIYELTVPVDEQLVSSLYQMIMTLIAGIIGSFSAARAQIQRSAEKVGSVKVGDVQLIKKAA